MHLMWFQGFHGVYFLFIDVILVMLSHSLILQSQDVLVCSAVQCYSMCNATVVQALG